MGVTDKLTKRVGPLPVWGYGAAAIGGYLGYKLLTGGGNKSSDTQYVATPTGAPQFDPSYPSSGAFEALRQRLEEVAGRDTSPSSPNTDTPGSVQPVYDITQSAAYKALAPAATYDHARGAWTVHNWDEITPDTLADIAWAHSVGRGPRTGAERDPTIERIKQLMASGMNSNDALIKVQNELAPLRGTGAIGNPASGQNTIPTDPNGASVKRRTGGQIRERYQPGRARDAMRSGSAISSPAPPASATPTRLPTPPINIPFLAPTTRVRTMPVSAGPHTPTITVGERAHLLKGRFQNPFRRR